MGLDMYLNKHTYIGNKWKEPKDQTEIKVAGIKRERVQEIIEEVGRWRKANAIHNWFVQNVQEGNDDCNPHYVEREQLEELLNLVKAVLDDHSKAEELLPVYKGFFFGSYEYDEYYFEDLVETKKILESVLSEDDNESFYYQSSW